MAGKIRHQLFLSQALTDRLEALAARPGASKSAVLADAIDAWLARRGTSELDDRFGLRLDRITAALSRIERGNHILLESLALFIRYELAIHPPLAETDQAGRAKARERFAAFVDGVARQVASGRKSFDPNGEGGL